MQEEAPRPSRRLPVLGSGPLRLALMVLLTAVAVGAPLVGAIRTAESQDNVALSEQPDAFEAQATPTPSAVTSPTPTPEPLPTAEPIEIAPPVAVVVATGAGEAPVAVETAAVEVGALEPAAAVDTDAAEVDAADTATAEACLLPEADVAPVEEQEVSWFTDDFDDQRPEWRPLAGSWIIDQGTLTQTDPAGYDLITELAIPLPTEVSISTTMTPLSDVLGGGLMLGQPVPMLRNGATIVDFTDGGRFLRWGSYTEDTGEYQYRGGVVMRTDFDPLQSHTLTVLAAANRTTVLVDDVLVGTFDPVQPGQAGLQTSAASIAFENLVIRDIATQDATAQDNAAQNDGGATNDEL